MAHRFVVVVQAGPGPDRAGSGRSALALVGGSVAALSSEIKHSARTLAFVTIFDIGVFFAVLLVGFAYVWKRGDLDWVRAVTGERGQQRERAAPAAGARAEEPALSA